MRHYHPPSHRLALALAMSLPVLVISSGACGRSTPTEPSPESSAISLSPKIGLFDGTTTVIIRGSGFREGATVRVDGIVVNLNYTTSDMISAVFPAHPPGVVDVSVTNKDQPVSAQRTTTFTYFDPATAPLLVFTDPVSGLSTSDLHDAQEEIVQFNVGYLIWSDGARFPGFVFDGVNISAERLCSCWIQIRFGSRNGNRRAYLTATYPHEGNPGTVLDLERNGGALNSYITHVPVSEPGPNTFSGVMSPSASSRRRRRRFRAWWFRVRSPALSR